MVELTELDGVGPARSESLEEAGYESVEAIAGADPEELAEEAEVPEDTALDFIVQAENITASEDADVEESEPQSITEEIEEATEEDEEPEVEEESEPEPEPEPEVEEVQTYTFTLETDAALEYDVFYASLLRHRETMLSGNRTNTEIFDQLLAEVRDTGAETVVEIEATQEELNQLHNAVRKLVVYYQGENLIDHMNALKAVQAQVNEAREKFLF